MNLGNNNTVLQKLLTKLNQLIGGTATVAANITEVNSNPATSGSGVVTAGTLRITLADDDPAVVQLGLIKAAVDSLEEGSGFLIGYQSPPISDNTFSVALQTLGPPGVLRFSNAPTWFPLTDFKADNIEKVDRYDVSGAFVATYTRQNTVITYDGTQDLTLTGITLTGGDSFVVYTNVSTAASSNYAEDTAHTSGDILNAVGAVRMDTPAARGADADYVNFIVDDKNHLWTHDINSTAILADTSAMAVDLAAIEVLITAGNVDLAAMEVLLTTEVAQTLPLYTSTNVAHDAVDAGNGFKGAGYAVSTQRAAVSAGDRVDQVLSLNGETISRSHDYTNAAEKIIEQAPYWAHRTTVEHDATLTATAKSYYVIPFDTYKAGSIINRYIMGAGSSAVVKVYATNDPTENISTITIANWFDVSTTIIGGASLAAGAGATTDAVWFVNTTTPMEYYLIEVDYTDAADSTVEIKAKLAY